MYDQSVYLNLVLALFPCELRNIMSFKETKQMSERGNKLSRFYRVGLNKNKSNLIYCWPGLSTPKQIFRKAWTGELTQRVGANAFASRSAGAILRTTRSLEHCHLLSTEVGGESRNTSVPNKKKIIKRSENNSILSYLRDKSLTVTFLKPTIIFVVIWAFIALWENESMKKA